MKKLECLCMMLLGSAVFAQLFAQNPLAGLPSQPGSHVAQIQALGDNQWLNLGSPAADPTWGKGRGRSWGGYMAYAPDMKGAFLAGQSTHGYINPDGRYDDIFFYDINANRWICVFPGVNTTTFVADINSGNLKMRDDGQLVDGNGQPVLLAYTGHSYMSYTYAADLRRWVSVANQSGIGGDQYSNAMQWFIDGRTLLQAQMAGKTDSVSGRPFFYNTVSGQFERYHFNLIETGGTGAVIYYLSSKQKLWHYNGNASATRLGDFATKLWSNAGATGAGPSGIDFGGCYDTKRNCIYLGQGSYTSGDPTKVFCYNVETNTWSSPANAGARTFGHSNTTVVTYDAAGDRVLNVDHNSTDHTATVSVFNPGTWSWDETLQAPAGVNSQECWHGFYSPELNAHFFYIANDSYDNGVMWAYRYKAAGSTVETAVAAKARVDIEVSPNPFRQRIKINIAGLSNTAGAQVKVFDLRGRVVADLSDALKERRGAGLEWDAGRLNAGVYLVRVTHQGKTFVKSLVCER